MAIYTKKWLIGLLLFCNCFCFGQKKIAVKHYQNNDPIPIEEVKIIMVTQSDSITLPIVEEKIQLSKDMKENFSLFANFKGKTIAIGSYRRAKFEELDIIIVGHITDFSVLKKSWEFKDAYLIDNKYLIRVDNANTIADLIYTIVQKDTDISLHSNFKQYVPMFTSTQEIVKTTN